MPASIKSNIEIDSYLIKQKSLIDNNLKKIFEETNYIEPKNLWNALRYSLLDGGKRIRGILCLATNEALGNFHTEDCLTTACSIELIHAMSLVHDDLPSMDNDDLRRGKPSCHKAFGEATAILVGDAMLSLSFLLITKKTKNISEFQKLEIVKLLSNSFSFGLVPGQILDMSSGGKTKEKWNLETLKKTATLKTAELIKASIICGGIISLNKNNFEKYILHLSNFGEKIGIAFQIIDDILDITADTKTLGKTSHKDEKQKKLTYPNLLGLEKSKQIAKELVDEAKSGLEKIPLNNLLLHDMADYIINRIN